MSLLIQQANSVKGLPKAYANELAEHIFQINAIAPGYIATDNTVAIRADEKRNTEILSRILAGYWVCPANLMGAFVFLASTASNYIGMGMFWQLMRLAGEIDSYEVVIISLLLAEVSGRFSRFFFHDEEEASEERSRYQVG